MQHQKLNNMLREENINLQNEIEEMSMPKIEQEEKQRISILEDDLGFVEVVRDIPTGRPSHFMKRIQLLNNAGIIRLYVFNNRDNVWHFVNLT